MGGGQNRGKSHETGVKLGDVWTADARSAVTLWDAGQNAADQCVAAKVVRGVNGQGKQTVSRVGRKLPAGVDCMLHVRGRHSRSVSGWNYDGWSSNPTNANNAGPANAEEVCLPGNVSIAKTAD